MKKSKKPIARSALLLNYNQRMYLLSINEIILYVTKQFHEKYQTPVFRPGLIGEYDRIILNDVEVPYLKMIQDELESYGIHTFIGHLEDPEFRYQRLEYIKYKFPDKDPLEEEIFLRELSFDRGPLILQYEPIILEVNDVKNFPSNEKLLVILYEQYLAWNQIKQILHQTAKEFRIDYYDEKINKFERVYWSSTKVEKLQLVQDHLLGKGVQCLILDNTDSIMPFRLGYIRHYYPGDDVAFLHAKWRLEFENGWFNREHWDPMIRIKKPGAKA